MKKAYVLILVLWVLSEYAAAQVECGRPLDKRVLFNYSAGHPRNNSTTLHLIDLMFPKEGKSPQLVAFAESESDFYSDGTITSKDGGKTWVRGTDDASLDGSTGVWRGMSEGPTRYRFLPELGLYLRSDDSGNTWHLPAYRVSEINNEGRDLLKDAEHMSFAFVALDPRDSRVIYSVIRSSKWLSSRLKYFEGVFVSRDGGENWNKFSNSLLSGDQYEELGPAPLGISPIDQSIFFGVAVRGIVESKDGGKTWRAVGQQAELEAAPAYAPSDDVRHLGAPFGLTVKQFALSSVNRNHVYVVSNKGLLISHDQGKTWSLADLGFDELNSVNSVLLSPIGDNEIFVGTRRGLFISRDSGCTFKAQTRSTNTAALQRP